MHEKGYSGGFQGRPVFSLTRQPYELSFLCINTTNPKAKFFKFPHQNMYIQQEALKHLVTTFKYFPSTQSNWH
jgi:hypothetical protein